MTLSFAGPVAAVGVAVQALMMAALGLLGVMLLMAAITLQLPMLGGGLGGLVTLGAAAMLGASVRRDLHLFASLEIAPDGRWVLRNPVGIELISIPADQPRALDRHEAQVTRYMGSVRVDREAWLTVELPDGRVFESAHAPPKRHQQTLAQLEAHLQQKAHPRSPQP